MLGVQRWPTYVCTLSFKEIVDNSREALCLFFSFLGDKEKCKHFYFFSSRIFRIFLEHTDSNLVIHWVAIADLFSAHCYRINLDFKFDLGDNVILEIYKAELLDNIKFIFFLLKYS